MDFVAIEPKFAPLCEALDLRTAADFVRFFTGDERPGKKEMIIRSRRIEAPGGAPVEVFYKQYECGRPLWSFWGRPSKARTEFRNYGVFRELSLATADRVACGEQRDGLGRLLRAFIVTVAIPGALPLQDFVARHCPRRDSDASRAMRDNLWSQLAGMTQTIHRAGFFHHDLVWRNVLGTLDGGAPKLWWIDCPSGGSVRFGRHRRRLKDLASLDKLARKHCTRGERLKFLGLYLGQPPLSDAVTQLAREVLDYRRTRWPEDWVT